MSNMVTPSTAFSRSQTAGRLLALLTTIPGEELHTRELVRRIGGSVHPVQRALERLESEGIVRSRRVANLRLWSIDPKHPLLHPLRELYARTHGVVRSLQTALGPLGVSLAFIFGSFAQGRDDAESDVDVLTVGGDWAAVDDAARASLERSGRRANIVPWTDADLARRIRERSPFLSTLREQPKMWVIGDDDSFERRIRAPHPSDRLRRKTDKVGTRRV
ncbi:MAG TPA: GntR family transcriptional regulator [Candidatus Saccharimonadales bacterium]|nr:GntR family transcriptional regulator [Candidatus Saccharimonadales bacterium]